METNEQIWYASQDDSYITNYPFDTFDDAPYIEKHKPKCTCGAGKLGYVELRAHYSWCDLQPEVKK